MKEVRLTLTVMDSRELLTELGYEYYSYVEPEVEPEHAEVKFLDLIPSLSALGPSSIAHSRLYKHQLEAYEALRSGRHLILKSGTGSGKTEAWLLYVLSSRSPTLAVYPTLALANDQVKRIKEYASAAKLSVEVLDASRRDELVKQLGAFKARSRVTGCDVIVTNPALLLNEVKRWALGKRGLLEGFLQKLELLVLDEADFYGPREVALLLALVKALRYIKGSSFKVAVLTAMLENPEDLASYLGEVLGGEAAIVEGRPFRVENRVYVALGRDLRKAWEELRAKLRLFEEGGVGQDVLEALSSFEVFKANLYKVVEAARSIGLEPPPLELDPVDLLARYVEDRWVTLVFTRSIAKAEELARRLRESLPEELKGAVASHHHLLSRELRAEVEEGARSGKVKLLVSPRTLSQGIDIGTVARIVHVGLPEDVREFHQREGRKGRRKVIPFSETVIIPGGGWDRELLSRGLDALKEWLTLPIEKVAVNPGNEYIRLFESLLKFVSPKLKHLLSRDDVDFLEKLGLVKRGELTRKGKEVWRNLNFYEYGPPFGVNRVVVDEQGERYLEGISHCDLVERFQVGCFDYTSDGVVVEHRLGGRSGRVVTAVVEERLRESTLWRREGLAEALEEYREVKARWREEPSIVSDYVNGRLHSDVLCVVYPPRRGFGKLLKIPNRVTWRVYSTKPVIKRLRDKTLVFRDFRVIPVPTHTHGKYEDYTYGSFYELDPSEDVNLLRLGLALVMVVLRKLKGIAFETIMYDLGKVGERKYLGLHEPESAGLIPSLDWLEVKRLVEAYEPSELDEVLIRSFDEYAYADLVSMNLDWGLVKEAAIKALDYILLESRVKLSFKGVELSIPKPSRALRLASLDAAYIPLVEEAKVGLACLSLFDGEEVKREFLHVSFGSIRDDWSLDKDLARLIDRDFTVAVYGLDNLLNTLSSCNLRALSMMLKYLSQEGKLIDVKEEAAKTLGVAMAPLDELSRTIMERSTSLLDVAMEAEIAKQKVSRAPLGDWQRYTTKLKEVLENYLAENCRAIYLLHLALKEYSERAEKTP